MYANLLQPPLQFLYIILIILTFKTNLCYSTKHHNDPRYDACRSNSSSKCGKSLHKIGYPFWENGRPQYNGHPGFNLSCDGSNLKIKITNGTYNIISIDYNTSTFKIVDEQFSRGECPERGEALHNTTLDWALFNYTSDVKNASLFYDCPSEYGALMDTPFSFSCELSYPINPLSFFVITENWKHKLGELCGVKVYVPILNSTFKSLIYNNPSFTVGDVLKRGFEVKWVIDQGHCQECYKSGGCCGYNITLGESICFCQNGEYRTRCPQQPPAGHVKDLSLKAKVGIGVGAASGFLLIVITLLVFTRGKKHYHSSSSFAPPYSHPNTSQLLSSTSSEAKSSYFGARLFTYEELLQATSNFESSKELGKGGYGIVYYGKLQDGREVAIKRLYEKHNKQVAQFFNEVEILTQLDHPNLLKLYGCTTQTSHELLLVYEFIPNDTLADHLHGMQSNQTTLPWPIRLSIAIETATALVYLHARDIIHRDVKSKNILLTNDFSVKVADFGLSRLFPVDVSHVSTTPQGSPGYVDPEYHQCYQLTSKSDVYSFGVVLAELLSAKPAVDITRKRQEINLSSLAVNKISQRAWNEFIDPNLRFEQENNSKMRDEVLCVAELAFQCLQATRDLRPSMEQVLKSLKKIQGEQNMEVVDVTKDDVAVFKGCDSLTSSNDSEIKCEELIHT